MTTNSPITMGLPHFEQKTTRPYATELDHIFEPQKNSL